MNIPKLYKYRWFNEKLVSRTGMPNSEDIPQWQQVLYDGLIFPAAPETFNDPYDCDLVLEDTFIDTRAIRGLILEKLTELFPLSEKEELSLRNTANFEKELKTIIWKRYKIGVNVNGIIKTMMESAQTTMCRAREELRVACFSKTNQSILMWSHYAQNHQGFCIEYDFNGWECKKFLHPVHYVKNRHYVTGDFSDSLNPSLGNAIIDAALYKSSEWSYEKEWRIVIPKMDMQGICFNFANTTPVFLVRDYITAIYLGAKVSDRFIEEICIHYSEMPVKVYCMELMANSYSLRPKRIQ